MTQPVRSRAEVLECLESRRDEIRGLGVARLGLFGSFVRDEAGDASDVDFLVEFRPGAKTFRSFMGTVFLLEEVLDREVELVTPESLSPYMRDAIVRSALYVEP